MIVILVQMTPKRRIKFSQSCVLSQDKGGEETADCRKMEVGPGDHCGRLVSPETRGLSATRFILGPGVVKILTFFQICSQLQLYYV